MGTYIVHDLDPATVPLRRDLEPFISTQTILLCLARIDTTADQQTVLDEIIDNAEEEATSYARVIYTVPLVPIVGAGYPRDFVAAIGWLVAMELYSRGIGPTDAVKDQYKCRVEWLKQLAAGKIRIDAQPLTFNSETDGGFKLGSTYERQIELDQAFA